MLLSFVVDRDQIALCEASLDRISGAAAQLPAALKAARFALGLSQVEAADQVGVKLHRLQLTERGEELGDLSIDEIRLMLILIGSVDPDPDREPTEATEEMLAAITTEEMQDDPVSLGPTFPTFMELGRNEASPVKSFADVELMEGVRILKGSPREAADTLVSTAGPDQGLLWDSQDRRWLLIGLVPGGRLKITEREQIPQSWMAEDVHSAVMRGMDFELWEDTLSL